MLEQSEREGRDFGIALRPRQDGDEEGKECMRVIEGNPRDRRSSTFRTHETSRLRLSPDPPSLSYLRPRRTVASVPWMASHPPLAPNAASRSAHTDIAAFLLRAHSRRRKKMRSAPHAATSSFRAHTRRRRHAALLLLLS